MRSTPELDARTGLEKLATYPYQILTWVDDAGYPVRLLGEGAADGRNRLTVFFRIIMVIPQVIVLYFLNIAGGVVVLISWFAALFTGSVPEGLHNFMTGYLRWTTRVGAYALLLTDQYPPFSMS